jgi:hypothetical protein
MGMPRFTAESSLYKSSERYAFALAWGKEVEGRAVIPQQMSVRRARSRWTCWIDEGGYPNCCTGTTCCFFDIDNDVKYCG